MKLLITNDDGVYAAGIAALANALKQEHEVVLCAPAAEKSCSSHSITCMSPLRAAPVEVTACPGVRAYAVTGTPVDCVRLGTTTLEPDIDMVISGINHGPNVGRDVLYSGTVSAAMEAAAQGFPAVAVSVSSHFPYNLEPAAAAAVRAVRLLRRKPLPAGCILSVNVPDLPEQEIKGARAAKLGHMADPRPYVRRLDPFGGSYYWMPGFEDAPGPEPETDVALLSQGYITLTPLTLNWADAGKLQWMDKEYGKEMHHGKQ